MNKDKVREKLRSLGLKKDKFVPVINSPIEFRVASSVHLEGTVPTTVSNQSWPVFVFPSVYLDIKHLLSVKVIESKITGVLNRVELKINHQGCERLNALVSDSNATVVLFFNNYPLLNIGLTHQLGTSSVIEAGGVFQDNEQVDYFVKTIKSSQA